MSLASFSAFSKGCQHACWVKSFWYGVLGSWMSILVNLGSINAATQQKCPALHAVYTLQSIYESIQKS